MKKTQTFEITKLSEIERKKEIHLDHINSTLEENHLVRKHIPEGSGSLLRTVSDSLYFTSHYQNEIQQFCIRHLKHLITTNKLPSRLVMFKGNSMLWKDFSTNPNLPGFEKIILELISLLFRVKVVMYHISDDSYLHATIVNHKFDKQIEIVRTHGNNFDSVRSKRYMALAGICQNIVLNIIDIAMKGKSSDASHVFVDHNGDTYYNFDYENWLASKEELAKEGLKISRGRHKKSLSDNFNVNFDHMEEQQIKFYNMFMNDKPPDDFLKLLQKDRKETEDNIALNIDSRYMEEPWHEIPTSDLAIKNYPVSSSKLSSRAGSIQDLHIFEKLEQAATANNTTNTNQQTKSLNRIFFSDNQDFQQLEGKQGDNANLLMSPVHYVHSPPPGLTPTRYPLKTYSSENVVFTIQTPEKVKSHSQIFDYTPEATTSTTSFSVLSTPPILQQYSASTPMISGFMNARKAPNAKNLMLSPGYGTDEFKYISESNLDMHSSSPFPSQMLYDPSQPKSLQFGLGSAEKRKPIILDEGKQRHTGRLKFFDENKNYGFIIMDEDGSDIFVHYDDLQKAGINKDYLKSARMGQVIRLGFSCMKYIGKYDKSRKATEVQLLSLN